MIKVASPRSTCHRAVTEFVKPMALFIHEEKPTQYFSNGGFNIVVSRFDIYSITVDRVGSRDTDKLHWSGIRGFFCIRLMFWGHDGRLLYKTFASTPWSPRTYLAVLVAVALEQKRVSLFSMRHLPVMKVDKMSEYFYHSHSKLSQFICTSVFRVIGGDN